MTQDNPCFETQLLEILPRLWRFGYFLTGSRDTCDDLVQSTCERALSNRHQWRAGTRLDRWAMAIMHSIWINQLRAQKVRSGNGLVDPETHLIQDGAHFMELKVATREIAAVVQRLPADQRTALVLVCVQGYRYKEAAELMNVPVGTVMSRLARARQYLAECIAEPSLAGDRRGH